MAKAQEIYGLVPRKGLEESWGGFKAVPVLRIGILSDPIGVAHCDLINDRMIRVKIVMKEKVRVSQKELPSVEMKAIIDDGILTGMEMSWIRRKK